MVGLEFGHSFIQELGEESGSQGLGEDVMFKKRNLRFGGTVTSHSTCNNNYNKVSKIAQL